MINLFFNRAGSKIVYEMVPYLVLKCLHQGKLFSLYKKNHLFFLYVDSKYCCDMVENVCYMQETIY